MVNRITIMFPNILKEDCQSVYPFDEVSAVALCFEQFSRSSKVLFFIMPLVSETKMADTRKYSVSENHWSGEPRG